MIVWTMKRHTHTEREREDCTERQCWNIETALRGLSFAFAQSYKPSSPSLAAQIYSSNVSGTGLVITYLNDHPRHRTTNIKGWLNRLQEGRAQLKLDTHNCLDYSIRYPQLPWLFNGMQFRKGWTSSPLISTPYIGPLLFPCQIWSA